MANTDLASAFPVLHPDLFVDVVEGRPDDVALSVPGAPGRAVIARGVYGLVESFDGTRTCHEIADGMLAEGVGLPDRDVLLVLGTQLASLGLVSFVRTRSPEGTAAVEVIDELRFVCSGCGASCQGHLVNVRDAELDMIRQAHRVLAQRHPHLRGIDPIEHIAEEGKSIEANVLARTDDETCIFLGPDNLCEIHRELGAEHKPIVCRLFPIAIIETEDSIRVGLSGGCYNWHRAAKAEPPRTLPEVTGIVETDLPSATRRLLSFDGEIAEEVRAFEEGVLWILGQEGATVERLFAFLYDALAGAALPVKPGGVLRRPEVTAVLTARLRTFATALLASEHVPRGGTGEGSVTSHVADLFGFASGLQPRPFEDLSEGQLDHALRVLRGWVFLREWRTHATPALSVLIVLLGILLAGWRAGAQDVAVEDRDDAFGVALATWIRTVRTGIRVTMLFGEPGTVTAEIETFCQEIQEACTSTNDGG